VTAEEVLLRSSNMALQRTRRPRFLSGGSLRSLGSRLNSRLLDDPRRACLPSRW
jgi:hypothetical protein